RAVPPVREPDPPGRLHEPVVLHLSDLPATTAPRALLGRARGPAPGYPGRGRGRGEALGSRNVEERERLTASVRGHVQGVGFRWWVRSRALELGLTGSASNLEDGRVEVVAEGPRAACATLLGLLRGGATPGMVGGVVERWTEARGDLRGFIEQ